MKHVCRSRSTSIASRYVVLALGKTRVFMDCIKHIQYKHAHPFAHTHACTCTHTARHMCSCAPTCMYARMNVWHHGRGNGKSTLRYQGPSGTPRSPLRGSAEVARVLRWPNKARRRAARLWSENGPQGSTVAGWHASANQRRSDVALAQAASQL